MPPKNRYPYFDQLCRKEGLPIPFPEYRFHTERRWRFDFCWPEVKLAIEIDGAVWSRGRHTRGSGFVKDQEKMNAAIELGWFVLRYTPQTIDHKQINRVYRAIVRGR